MDWLKLYDKFYDWIYALIPGSLVVMVGVMHRPELWASLWNISYLGYQTKLVILVVVAFVLGSTVNSIVGAIVGGIQGGVSSYKYENARAATGAPGQGAQNQQPQLVPYWQDLNWRNLVTAYLGVAAPENLQPFYDEGEYKQAIELAKTLPPAERAREMNAIERRSSQVHLQHNDAVWQAYWFHLQGWCWYRRRGRHNFVIGM